MTLADLESLIDEDIVARGAVLCVGRTLTTEGLLPERLRFNVVSVCDNLDAERARVRSPRARGVAVVAMATHSTTRERSPPRRTRSFYVEFV